MRLKPFIFALIVIVLAISIPYYLDARIPRATAVIQVHPSMISIAPVRLENSTQPPLIRSYMESEFESILSPEVIQKATKEIASCSYHNEKDIPNLKVISTETPRRGTDFIEITVKHKDREFAALIANTLAEVYLNRRMELENKRAASALEALDEELQLQAELVSENKAAMEELSKTYGLNEAVINTPPKVGFTQGNSSLIKAIKEALPDKSLVEIALIEHNISNAKEDYEQSRDMLREMKVKQQEARVLLKMPKTPITIHERAK